MSLSFSHMPKLWNHISAKLWRAIPEGSRDELLGEAHGYVTQSGALSICVADRIVLLTLEQDYGQLIESYAYECGFEGPVIYTLAERATEDLHDAQEPVDPRTQLSLFGAPNTEVRAQTQEKRASEAALRIGSGRDFEEEALFDTHTVDAFAPTAPESFDFDVPALREQTQRGQAQREQTPREPTAFRVPTVEDVTRAAEEAGIHPHQGLDSWTCGEENLFAHGAANAVAMGDNAVGDMLFIQGMAGMGKTHLLQSIGLEALKRQPTLRVRYMRGETFVNAFIEAIRNKEMEAFRRSTRANVDLLLLDDVDFLAGKENCQEELLHALNDLLHAQKFVVVTSHVRRDELSRFDARLRNRLASGLAVSIDAPSKASRRDILKRAGDEQGINVPDDVLDFVAHTVRCNTRELLSHFSRVLSYARFTRRPLTLEVARRQIESSYTQATRKVTMTEIVHATVEHYDLRPKDIVGRGRTKRVVTPRKVAMFLGRKLTEMSFPELGRFFDNRDHTTVLDACSSITKQMDEDAALHESIKAIQHQLGVS